jgi:hypothetical protein
MTLDGDEFSNHSGFKVGPLPTVRFEEAGTLAYKYAPAGLLLQLQQIRGIGEVIDEWFGADNMFAVPKRFCDVNRVQMIWRVDGHDIGFRIVEDVLVPRGIPFNTELMAALLTEHFVSIADVSEFKLIALEDGGDGASSFTQTQDRYGRFFHLNI